MELEKVSQNRWTSSWALQADGIRWGKKGTAGREESVGDDRHGHTARGWDRKSA